MKKTPGGIIILNMSAINENHMMYDSWDMEHDRHNFLSFCTIFCPFTSTPSPTLTTQRIKILKKWKKTPGDIIILQKCTINDNHLIYGSWDMKCTRQTFFAIMGHFLSFYSANNENLKKKKKKNRLEISSFYTCVPKNMIKWCTVPEIWCTTDGRADGKSDI